MNEYLLGGIVYTGVLLTGAALGECKMVIQGV